MSQKVEKIIEVSFKIAIALGIIVYCIFFYYKVKPEVVMVVTLFAYYWILKIFEDHSLEKKEWVKKEEYYKSQNIKPYGYWL